MKKLMALALCAAMLLCAAGAMAADINFVTAGTASTFYPISATVVGLWNESIEGMRATATPSGGGIDNLNQAYDGDAQIGIANANLVYQAQEGLASFEGYANDNLRIFAGLYLNPNQVVVTKDSGINTVEDLIGRKISVGAAGSTTVDEATVHLSLYGKTLDDLKAEYMGTSESADAISNKQLEGVWVMAGTPNAAVTQIMTTCDAKLLPIPAQTVDALKVEYPWYASTVIPAGTYAGQGEDVETSAVKLTLFITADVDEETVYQMTKVFWENWDYLTETHAALKKADPKEACNDVAGVEIHPGAARYYREIGIMEYDNRKAAAAENRSGFCISVFVCSLCSRVQNNQVLLTRAEVWRAQPAYCMIALQASTSSAFSLADCSALSALVLT